VKIRLFGQRNILGGGVHFAEFADALKQLSFLGAAVEEVDLTKATDVETALRGIGTDDINIWFWRHPAIARAAGYNVVWAIFESDFIRSDFVNYFQQSADLVWVPSAWGKGVLERNGVAADKVDVVPEGVSAAKYHPFLRGERTKRPDKFKFLIVGKYEVRKGYSELLEAFARVFGDRNDVELLIKADFFLKHDEKKQQLEREVADWRLGNVKLLWGAWPEQQLYALFNHADAFVFPSKAEGWGLPLIQALACGLPTLATNYSGQSEYLGGIDGRFIPIEYSLEAITDPEFLSFWPPENAMAGNWAKPHVDSLANALEQMVDQYDRCRENAVSASEIIRRSFDWAGAATSALESLSRRGRLRTQLKLSI
jgi:glycosyltransferase involved in cell wall biosynthesis